MKPTTTALKWVAWPNSTPSPPHTSLMRRWHKTTGLHLLREGSLAPGPGEVPISAASTSKDPVKVKLPYNYHYPEPQPAVLFRESSLAPTIDTPNTRTADTLLRASCLKAPRPPCPFWDSIWIAVCTHIQYHHVTHTTSEHFATPWIAACQASLTITSSRSLLKLMSIKSMMPSNHLILCHPLLLLPSIFPSIRVFSSESVLCIRWPNYWSFSFSISLSNMQD